MSVGIEIGVRLYHGLSGRLPQDRCDIDPDNCPGASPGVGGSSGGANTRVDEPLSPSDVNLDGGLKDRMQNLLGLFQLGAWIVILASLFGCAVVMAWAWQTGKGVQALGKVGWVAGACIILASANAIISTAI
ncbi:hypothetical protein LO772_07865 [Yinghuangia sp. ASG 101]|uniref:hypothetical protein n=1 Tax=Yinghuangia sp. ASG 101 TaxID=2896848 RepID=UPI001E3C68EC|nr:hypothetical protein [Yinghuangia sp. ASG 101]UGQ13512.1 hypothetical protein LO772_07865 [Yinghuangia sp. ASG 101]